MSKSYHEYIFENGVFKGSFEEMYQNCDDPWRQLAVVPFANELILAEIEKHEYRKVLDVGCGLGKFSHLIQARVVGDVTGIDISSTAIEKARALHPDITFNVVDVTRQPLPVGAFDLIVVSELFWYVLDRLEFVVQNLVGAMAAGGCLIIIQQFYQPGEQKYGNDILSKPQDLMARLPLRIDRVIEVDRFTNHKVIIFGSKA